MSWWPFTRRDERRNFTDSYIAAMGAAATGAGDTAALGALECAAGFWARGFASARVEGASEQVKAVLTPGLLASIGRALIRRGESIHVIEVERGALRLTQAAAWDFRGTPDTESWFIRADLWGPSGTWTRFLPYEAILHCQYSFDPGRPSCGVAPLTWARTLAALATTHELRLSEESRMPVGAVLPWPVDPGEQDPEGEDTVTELKKSLAALRGTIGIAETLAGGRGAGRESAPQSDWKLQRIGSAFPAASIDLHEKTARMVLSACGVPPTLAAVGGDAAGRREAFREFVFSSLMPQARIVESELQEKLAAPGLRLEFSDMAASDIQGRARSYKAFIDAGMPSADAARIVGVSLGHDYAPASS